MAPDCLLTLLNLMFWSMVWVTATHSMGWVTATCLQRIGRLNETMHEPQPVEATPDIC